MPDLTFLAAEEYTTKDKLVLLTAATLDTNDAGAVADALGLGVASVLASLRKDPTITPKVTPTKEITEAIIDVCQMDRRSMRSSDWKLLAKVASELAEVGADAEEVHRRARNLPRRLRLPITPGSLDKYWAQLADRTPFTPAAVYGS